MGEYLSHLRTILKLLRKNNLYLNPSKCIFLTKEVDFIYHIIKEKNVRMNEGKVKTIKEWKALGNVKCYDYFWGW